MSRAGELGGASDAEVRATFSLLPHVTNITRVLAGNQADSKVAIQKAVSELFPGAGVEMPWSPLLSFPLSLAPSGGGAPAPAAALPESPAGLAVPWPWPPGAESCTGGKETTATAEEVRGHLL